MMLLQVILEGLGLGVLLVLVCTVGIRKGGGEDDRKNMAQKRKNSGCWRIFCGFRRSQRDWRMGQPPAGHQPGLYAGLQRPS